jgi:hypothetical protein
MRPAICESTSGGSGAALRFPIRGTSLDLTDPHWSRGIAGITFVAITLPGGCGHQIGVGAEARKEQEADTETVSADVSPVTRHELGQLARRLVGGSCLHDRNAPLN